MLGDLEGRPEAESTQRPQHHPWAVVLRLLSKEPAGKGINIPSFSTCLIPGRKGLYIEKGNNRSLGGSWWEAECSAERRAMGPEVARFSPHPLGMSPLPWCPCSRMSLAPLGTVISLVGAGGTLGSSQLPMSQKVWLPPNFLKDKSKL